MNLTRSNLNYHFEKLRNLNPSDPNKYDSILGSIYEDPQTPDDVKGWMAKQKESGIDAKSIAHTLWNPPEEGLVQEDVPRGMSLEPYAGQMTGETADAFSKSMEPYAGEAALMAASVGLGVGGARLAGYGLAKTGLTKAMPLLSGVLERLAASKAAMIPAQMMDNLPEEELKKAQSSADVGSTLPYTVGMVGGEVANKLGYGQVMQALARAIPGFASSLGWDVGVEGKPVGLETLGKAALSSIDPVFAGLPGAVSKSLLTEPTGVKQITQVGGKAVPQVPLKDIKKLAAQYGFGDEIMLLNPDNAPMIADAARNNPEVGQIINTARLRLAKALQQVAGIKDQFQAAEAGAQFSREIQQELADKLPNYARTGNLEIALSQELGGVQAGLKGTITAEQQAIEALREQQAQKGVLTQVGEMQEDLAAQTGLNQQVRGQTLANEQMGLGLTNEQARETAAMQGQNLQQNAARQTALSLEEKAAQAARARSDEQQIGAINNQGEDWIRGNILADQIKTPMPTKPISSAILGQGRDIRNTAQDQYGQVLKEVTPDLEKIPFDTRLILKGLQDVTKNEDMLNMVALSGNEPLMRVVEAIRNGAPLEMSVADILVMLPKVNELIAGAKSPSAKLALRRLRQSLMGAAKTSTKNPEAIKALEKMEQEAIGTYPAVENAKEIERVGKGLEKKSGLEQFQVVSDSIQKMDINSTELQALKTSEYFQNIAPQIDETSLNTILRKVGKNPELALAKLKEVRLLSPEGIAKRDELITRFETTIKRGQGVAEQTAETTANLKTANSAILAGEKAKQTTGMAEVKVGQREAQLGVTQTGRAAIEGIQDTAKTAEVDTKINRVLDSFTEKQGFEGQIARGEKRIATAEEAHKAIQQFKTGATNADNLPERLEQLNALAARGVPAATVTKARQIVLEDLKMSMSKKVAGETKRIINENAADELLARYPNLEKDLGISDIRAQFANGGVIDPQKVLKTIEFFDNLSNPGSFVNKVIGDVNTLDPAAFEELHQNLIHSLGTVDGDRAWKKTTKMILSGMFEVGDKAALQITVSKYTSLHPKIRSMLFADKASQDAFDEVLHGIVVPFLKTVGDIDPRTMGSITGAPRSAMSAARYMTMALAGIVGGGGALVGLGSVPLAITAAVTAPIAYSIYRIPSVVAALLQDPKYQPTTLKAISTVLGGLKAGVTAAVLGIEETSEKD